MVNIIVAIIIIVIIGFALARLYLEKKKGSKCVGCPYSNANGSNNCHCDL